jgi:hypothetical protein
MNNNIRMAIESSLALDNPKFGLVFSLEQSPRPELLWCGCRKNKTPPLASASPPANSALSSAAGQTFVNHCHQKPSGNTKSATNAYAIKSKHSKHKPSKHASANTSTFAPSLITPPRPPISALSALPPSLELPLREVSSVGRHLCQKLDHPPA